MLFFFVDNTSENILMPVDTNETTNNTILLHSKFHFVLPTKMFFFCVIHFKNIFLIHKGFSV